MANVRNHKDLRLQDYVGDRVPNQGVGDIQISGDVGAAVSDSGAMNFQVGGTLGASYVFSASGNTVTLTDI